MKIQYYSKFIQKAYCKNYPIQGFFYKLGNFTQMYNDELEYIIGSSDPRLANTILDDKGLALSINLSHTSDSGGQYDRLYLFYKDYLTKPSLRLSDFLSHQYSKQEEYLESFAAMISWDDDIDCDNLFKYNEIIYLDYPIPGKRITCSLDLINEPNATDLEHFSSDFMGISNFYTMDNDNTKLISTESGIDKAREYISDLRYQTLNGTMHFDTSGIITM